MYGHAVEYQDRETAEASTEASLGLQVSDGCAEAGGNGLLLHEEQLGLGSFVGVIEGGIGVGCEGLEDDGFWGFDHEESGDKTTEGVGDLGQTSADVRVWEATLVTRHGRDSEEEEDRKAHDNSSPCWQPVGLFGVLLEVCMAHLSSSAEEGSYGLVQHDGGVDETNQFKERLQGTSL